MVQRQLTESEARALPGGSEHPGGLHKQFWGRGVCTRGVWYTCQLCWQSSLWALSTERGHIPQPGSPTQGNSPAQRHTLEKWTGQGLCLFIKGYVPPSSLVCCQGEKHADSLLSAGKQKHCLPRAGATVLPIGRLCTAVLRTQTWVWWNRGLGATAQGLCRICCASFLELLWHRTRVGGLEQQNFTINF